MSWHDTENFMTCLEKSPNGISIFNVLTERIDKRMAPEFVNEASLATAAGGRYVFFVGDHRLAHRTNDSIQRAQQAAFDTLPLEVDIFDEFAFTFPRDYTETCDASHVSCVFNGRLTALAYWELLILAQLIDG